MKSLVIQAKTEITNSNLQEFTTELKKQITEAKIVLKTEDDFAEAEAFVKTLSKAEQAMKKAKEKIFDSGELKKINEIFIESLDLSSKTRINLNKQVETEKQRKKDLMVDAAYNSVLTAKNNSLYPQQISMPVKADFFAQIKGKKSLDSMQAAVDRFAGVQLQDIQQQTNQVNQKLKLINALINGYEALFDINYLIGYEGEVDEYINKIIDGHKSKVAAEKLAEESKKVLDQASESKPVAHEVPKTTSTSKTPSDEPKQKHILTINFYATPTTAKNQARQLADKWGRNNVELEVIE